MIQFNSQADARSVSGRCNFDSFFCPLSLFRNSRPKMVVIRKYIFADAYLVLDTCFGGTSFIYKKLHKHSSILSVSYFFCKNRATFPRLLDFLRLIPQTNGGKVSPWPGKGQNGNRKRQKSYN